MCIYIYEKVHACLVFRRAWFTVGQQGHQVTRRTLRPVGSTRRFPGPEASDLGKRTECVLEEAVTVGLSGSVLLR